jgi:hypothetical protein
MAKSRRFARCAFRKGRRIGSWVCPAYESSRGGAPRLPEKNGRNSSGTDCPGRRGPYAEAGLSTAMGGAEILACDISQDSIY